MKRIFWFSMAMAVTTVILTAVTAGLFFSGVFKSSVQADSKNHSSVSSLVIKAEPNTSKTEALVLFSEGERLEAGILSLDFASKSVSARAVNLTDAFGNEPFGVMANIGTYPFIDRCLRASQSSAEFFVIINSENFIKLADKCQGIVYNNSVKEAVLLTGSQAEQLISADTFPEFCRQLAEYGLDGHEAEMLIFLTANTENNLSLPSLFDLLY